MLSDELKLQVDLYFDGELNKRYEAFLFSELAKNEECREYFRQTNRINNILKEAAEEFPVDLEKRIFSKIRNLNEKPFWYKQIFPVVSYSFAVLLLIISLFMFFEMREYRNEIQFTSRQMNEQQKTINLLINSLPSVEVESEIQNAVIIKANL
jgi:predicted anti-sigma-YlaC factor YlaD